MAKTTDSKATKPKPKREKPLTRRMTAPVVMTGSSGDNYALELVHRADIAVRAELGGRPLSYMPEELWDKFVEYVEWKVGNPGKVERPFSSGVIAITTSDRPMGLGEFAVFAGITPRTLHNYEEREEFFPIIARVREVIYRQKFDGAVRGIFDSNIIARDLGIGDKLDIAGLFDPTKPIVVEFGVGNSNVPTATSKK